MKRLVQCAFLAPTVALATFVVPQNPAIAATGSQLLVNGFLTSSGGPGSVSGAAIILKFLDYDAAVNTDDPVPEYTLKKVYADAGGNYSVSVDPATLPAVVQNAAEANGGSYNLDLVAETKDGRRAYGGVARNLESGLWTSPEIDDLGGSGSLSMNMNAQTEAELTGEASGGVAAQSATAYIGSYCHWTLNSEVIRATKLMSVHSSSRTTGNWHYGRTASSTIDWALTYTAGGPFSIGGGRSITNSRTTDVGMNFSGSRHSNAASEFVYRTFVMKPENSAATYCTNYTNHPGSKRILAMSWHGSAYFTDTLSTISCGTSWPASWRQTFGAGGYLIKAESKTQKINAAISIGGANLGASSTYVKGLKFRLNWPSTGGIACGNNANPFTSQFIYVQ